MAFTRGKEEKGSGSGASPAASQALQWIWQHHSNVARPNCLECGPIRQTTLGVLLKRGAKVYHSDLITPLQNDDPAFWSQTEKTKTFHVEEYLALIPPIPTNTLSAIFCWGLFDVVPREALPTLVERFHSFLEPAGALFCILREASLTTGVDTGWWFDSLSALGSSSGAKKPFPYPPVTNREMERIFPGGNVKTFLTRTGRREIVALK